MKQEIVMRGKTPSGENEILNFSGLKPGYAYRLINFEILFSTGIGTTNQELCASLTAAKTYENPASPNFKNQGLIATATLSTYPPSNLGSAASTVINHTFLITQDLILAVVDTVSGAPADVNWQCTFVAEKMNDSETAVANYKQFTISDE